jgi:hypothetical protein
MKYAPFVLLFVLASCIYFQTKQQRAEGLAKKYLDSALGPDKYEIIDTGRIDTLRGGPETEPGYQLITKKIDSTYQISDSLNKLLATSKNNQDISVLKDLSQKNYNKRTFLLKESLNFLLNYKGKPEGWIIEETYKLKNGIDSSLYHATFKIDDKLSKILSQQTTKKLISTNP